MLEFLYFFAIIAYKHGNWHFVYVIISIGRVIVLWVIWKHFAQVFIRNYLWNIADTHRAISKHSQKFSLDKKSIILLRLCASNPFLLITS